uniref:Uncharacterized protein n=1 Tax=Kalanchoe fedtschenkoi TaxID=63787 RepID=A0A7N0U1G1_KALFE
MYVTKTLSSLLRSPEILSQPPPDGPFSGVAVIMDEESMRRKGKGSSQRADVNYLPIPQNKLIKISRVIGDGEESEYVMMIPVVDEPLSSDTYYVIKTTSKMAGLSITCSNEEVEMENCFCCSIPIIKDATPQPFDPNNIYQQFKIIQRSGEGWARLHAESLVYDGRPPYFMTKEGWETTRVVSTSWPCDLNEADGQGLCATLRDRLPEFGFPVWTRSSDHVVVGTWCVPFIFVKEFGMRYEELMRSSTYYKMSLEQRWERIFEWENLGGDLVAMAVDVGVKSEVVMLGGMVAVQRGGQLVEGVVRYEIASQGVGGIGVSVGVVERMKWEQARGGWVDVGGGEVRVERVEECPNGRGWRRFGCYVLVERFVLRRMDGSLALTHDFYHTHQLRYKWGQF